MFINFIFIFRPSQSFSTKMRKKKYRSSKTLKEVREMENRSYLNKLSNRIYKNNHSAVPALSNVDDIFEVLSTKIAKYCQVLADLTNCEVFFKAQLPQNLTNFAAHSLSSFNCDQSSDKDESKKKINLNKRSVYWGTHHMLFQHSHNQGLKYDKSAGDSLIKIAQRSFPNDVNNLIDEVLNGDPLGAHDINLKNVSNEKSDTFHVEPALKPHTNASSSEIQIKDCCIRLKRIDDSVYSQYLNKIENVNVNQQQNANDYDLDMSNESELYEPVLLSASSKTTQNFLTNTKTNLVNNEDGDNEEEEDDDDADDDDDEKTFLEKKMLNANEDNDEDGYSCELCLDTNCSFKHLTQLKVSKLEGVLEMLMGCLLSKNEQNFEYYM